jgi:hypothetical protein
VTDPLPFSDPEAYVREHREDLMVLVLNGDPMVRALALAVFVEAGGDADLDLVEREVQMAQELGDDLRQEVLG